MFNVVVAFLPSNLSEEPPGRERVVGHSVRCNGNKREKCNGMLALLSEVLVVAAVALFLQHVAQHSFAASLAELARYYNIASAASGQTTLSFHTSKATARRAF